MSLAGSRRWALSLGLAGLAGLTLGACTGIGETNQRGYLADEETLGRVKQGMDAQTVLTTLGTPSTVSTVGNRTWYYISQTTRRRVAFMKEDVVDQKVVAVYFDKNLKVERTALWGIEDGKIFDYISRTTPAGGAEQSLLGNIFKGFTKFNPLGA
jgi:outer membrane protein assembly factor BamE (lipoprotein component of BamABCDE complex)